MKPIMQVIPAIDLRGGLCVRLRQGDYSQETIFGDDPALTAGRWESEGATRIHLVDLDGAKEGRPVNVESVRKILARVKVPCQLGGGVRSDETVKTWLDEGIDRVIVGTRALKDPKWFRGLVERFPGKIVLGLDARDGRVATEGWLEVSSIDASELALGFDDLLLAAIVYTDIACDGMLQGPNADATADLARKCRAPVIASGGIGGLEDLSRLAALPISACIVGRALYDGRFNLREARASARDDGTAP
ncbi:MAG: 1-(5-phosphoribosyl)-5-[(5-phosphoribosylamino) methylideneamino]imidazole-4-carboxamide isomerase [Isosphaeraceae bacterium]